MNLGDWPFVVSGVAPGRSGRRKVAARYREGLATERQRTHSVPVLTIRRRQRTLTPGGNCGWPWPIGIGAGTFEFVFDGCCTC